MTLLAVMLFYYTQLGAHESFWKILPGLLVGGVGMGMTMTPTTAAAMSAVAVDKAGVGSAVLNSRAAGGRLARDRRHGRRSSRAARATSPASTTRCGSVRCSASPAPSSR